MEEDVLRLVCFQVCGEAFAFDMQHLIEIVQIRASEITPCFTPVPVIRGTWMYREQPVYVIDLRDFFKLEEPPHSSDSLPYENPLAHEIEGTALSAEQDDTSFPQPPWKEKREKSMLVVRIRDQIFGMFTDKVLQVVPLGGFYEFPDLISTLPKQYFAGIIQLHHTLVLILAIEMLLGEHEIKALLASQPLPSARAGTPVSE